MNPIEAFLLGGFVVLALALMREALAARYRATQITDATVRLAYGEPFVLEVGPTAVPAIITMTSRGLDGLHSFAGEQITDKHKVTPSGALVEKP
jgi:hypothetical protein